MRDSYKERTDFPTNRDHMTGRDDVHEPLIADKSSWNTNLSDCCDDCGVCWRVSLCPLRSLTRLHARAFGDCGDPGCLLEQIDRSLNFFIDEVMSGNVRNRLKYVFGIRGIESNCTTCCCFLCTLCQEEREVKIRDAELTQLPDEAPSSSTRFER